MTCNVIRAFNLAAILKWLVLRSYPLFLRLTHFMSDRVHTVLIIFSSFAVLCAGLSLVSVQVSLKYETGADSCLSLVSGRDLCADYRFMKWVTGGLFVLVMLLIGFSNQLINKK
ncbi:hypothetical protein PK28_10830 [Hymenobacter sp. DG25B]|nr:hypothetical protein PK28_10830 [Hymenobacter sp. DG25B]